MQPSGQTRTLIELCCENLLIDHNLMFEEMDRMTLIPCYSSVGFLLVPMQYLRVQCDIDSQFDMAVDNMERRGMIWSYEC